MLTAGFHAVPRGHLACVVTHMEMRAPPKRPPSNLPEGVTFRHVLHPDTVWYRDLFRRVGGLEWLWVSRLKMAESDLQAILSDPKVQVIVVDRDGQADGLLELDFRAPGRCELAFFGLTPALIGRGIGRALMGHAIETAFAAPIDQFIVHTCTLDHPDALGFYRRSGFEAVRQEVEIIADPRVSGLLPTEAGPRWPVMP